MFSNWLQEQHGRGGGDGGPCSTLFIANLGPNCTADELKQAFSALVAASIFGSWICQGPLVLLIKLEKFSTCLVLVKSRSYIVHHILAFDCKP
jgi:hypothetical protein